MYGSRLAADHDRREVLRLPSQRNRPGSQEGRLVNVHEEDGQVLVLAVAFLLFAALVIGTILTFANASELSTARLREQRNSVYAADGATDAAIQAARVDATVGAYGDPRCHASNPTSPTGPILLTTTSNNSTVASVICTWSSD